MKTPDAIKKGLECCNTYNGCQSCPYDDKVEKGWSCCVQRNADALAYIQQLEGKVPQWISVKDRLPETDNYCIVFEPGYGCEVCMYYGDGEWLTRDLSNVTRLVSHWKPLPELPEEEV